MRKYKVCIFTATRAEYGLLRWLMHDIKNAPNLTLQVLVSGAHLSPMFGETWREIEADGFKIDIKVKMLTAGRKKIPPQLLVKSVGKCAALLGEAFASLDPDLLVVLGDRYELLPACTAALLMDIPVAHISGGDITEGAIDDSVRHAVTKLSSLHLVSSEEARRRVLQLGEESDRVFLCGGPGLDNLRRLPEISRENLGADLGLNVRNKWALLTWHPETRLSTEANLNTLRNILRALAGRAEAGDFETVATYANADLGGSEINAALELAAKNNPWLKVTPNLGQLRYVNMLRQVKFMLGNSSSAIFETPALNLPAVNIGSRQKGRALTPNIIQCGHGLEEVAAAAALAENPEFTNKLREINSPYGNGHFAEKALAALEAGLNWGQRRLLNKRFVDLPANALKAD